MPYIPGHAVKYLRKGKITFLFEVFLGEERVLKVLFVLWIVLGDPYCGLQKWAFAVVALERAAALSGKLQRCIWPRSQFCKAKPSWWFPAQPGVGGTGKRGSLELNLTVLHFPRESKMRRGSSSTGLHL